MTDNEKLKMVVKMLNRTKEQVRIELDQAPQTIYFGTFGSSKEDIAKFYAAQERSNLLNQLIAEFNDIIR